MYLLSLELFGRPLTLPEFPEDKAIMGLGLSDWEGYGVELERALSYSNTYYHREPRLDITHIDPALTGRYTFIIASDVFEHIPIEGLRAAFANAYRLLAKDGFVLFTVPFTKKGDTVEHFPNLHDFSIEETDGVRVLRNKTVDGTREVFRDLVFHGGDGSTLEMRHFSEPAIRREFARAGFHRVDVRSGHYPLFGILWPMDWAVPMIARKSVHATPFMRGTKRRLRRLIHRSAAPARS
jgi:hypothetical protein